MRLIDGDALSERMYHEAFEKDSDMQRWDSGCWIRYKLFEQELENVPTIRTEPQWIPVDLTNDSPPEDVPVLLGIRFKNDFKWFVTSRQDYNYQVGLGRDIRGELRWCKLPEPYREEGGE